MSAPISNAIKLLRLAKEFDIAGMDGIAEAIEELEQLQHQAPIGEVWINAVYPNRQGWYRHEFYSKERISVGTELFMRQDDHSGGITAMVIAQRDELVRQNDLLIREAYSVYTDACISSGSVRESIDTWRPKFLQSLGSAI